LNAWLPFPFLSYSFGLTGSSKVESAFENEGLELDITLAAANTDVIKTYVRRDLGVGLIAAMAYDPLTNQDLIARDLSHLIPGSRTKIAYLRHNCLPLYSQHYIAELLLAAKEIKC